MKKILIVDDSIVSRKMLRKLFEAEGFEVAGEAIDGKEGYEQYVKLSPDVVTMDITMPVLDGIDSLKLIREADPNAKVVMITAAGQKHKMMEAVKLGAAEFVAKPFVEESVVDAISRCC